MTNLNSTIFNHCVKINDKIESDKFQIKNIDFIYLINLDQRKERLIRCMQQFMADKIKPYRVSGVLGWKLPKQIFPEIAMPITPQAEYDLDVQVEFTTEEIVRQPFGEHLYGKVCLHRDTSAGAIGCYLSHLSILYDAYLAGYQTIWIVEDDITIRGNPHQLSEFIEQLDQMTRPAGWDVLYTDDDCYHTVANVRAHCASKSWLRPGVPLFSSLIERIPIGEDFFKIGGRTQTHSMIWSRQGIEKMLRFAATHRIFLPIDTDLGCVGLQVYNLKQDLVHGRDRSYSDTYYNQFNSGFVS